MPIINVNITVANNCKNCPFSYEPMEVGISWPKCIVFNDLVDRTIIICKGKRISNA